MANNFQIVISAVDKATATVQKINRSMDRLTRPVSQLRRSVSAFARASGLERFGKSMAKVGRAAGDVARKMASIAAPLIAVIGVGSIAGVTALAISWGHLGFEISRTSQLIGISAGELQALRGAAAVMGVSSEELTGGLKTLGDTLEDALYGRNQQALMMLNRMGIGIHHTANGAIDTARAFKDLAGAISRTANPQVQALMARAFGLEAALPLMRQGTKAIAAYEKKVRDLGGVLSNDSVEAARRFGISMNYLEISVQGLKNSISARLLPVLQPYIDRLTDWIAKNRDLIATKVTQFVQRLADALSRIDWAQVINGIGAFFTGVNKLVHALGGWKAVMIGVGVAMSAGLISNVIALGSAVLGLAGSLGQLSAVGVQLFPILASLAPYVAAIGGAAAIGYGIGKVGGWLIDKGIQTATGDKSATLGNKLYDWTSGNGNADNMQISMTPEQARADLARRKAALLSSAPNKAMTPTAAAAAPQQVHVEVAFKNAPAGVTATAKTHQGNYVPTRVAYSMPTTVMP